MDIRLLFTVAGTVFLAELGDKTQLATLLFASRSPSHLITVFVGAALALVFTSAIGVAVGGTLAHYINAKYLDYAAGAAFVLIGLWTIWKA